MFAQHVSFKISGKRALSHIENCQFPLPSDPTVSPPPPPLPPSLPSLPIHPPSRKGGRLGNRHGRAGSPRMSMGCGNHVIQKLYSAPSSGMQCCVHASMHSCNVVSSCSQGANHALTHHWWLKRFQGSIHFIPHDLAHPHVENRRRHHISAFAFFLPVASSSPSC